MFGSPLSRRNDYGSGGIEEQLEQMRSGEEPDSIDRRPGALANPRPMSNPMFAAYLVKLAGLLLNEPD